MPATYLTNQTLGVNLVSEVFTLNKLFGETWFVTAILVLITLALITRNLNKWKLLTLPVLVMWDITGMRTNLAIYAIATLLYVLALVETGVVSTLINATSRTLAEAQTGIERMGKRVAKGTGVTRLLENRQTRRLATRGAALEELKIAALNKRESRLRERIRKRLSRRDGEVYAAKRDVAIPTRSGNLDVTAAVKRLRAKQTNKLGGVKSESTFPGWSKVMEDQKKFFDTKLALEEELAKKRGQRYKGLWVSDQTNTNIKK